MKVVTWQSPSGDTLDICRECEVRLQRDRQWPKDGRGQEYCSVHHGLHESEMGCDADGHTDAPTV